METKEVKRKRKHSILPSKEIDIVRISKTVKVAWQNEQLFLRYATPDEFGRLIEQFQTSRISKGTKKRERNPVTDISHP